MSYLKLCQLYNAEYIEDCNGNVLLNSIVYPAILSCEVIDWESEEEYHKRGKANFFISESVHINEQPINVREEVFQQLLMKYEELVQ